MTSSELPLPDFDHLPLESLKHRVRSLDRDDVARLVEHEETSGHRLPVLEVLRIRLEQLDAGAEPSGGDPAGYAPEVAGPPQGTQDVGPDTAGPAVNPPSHGVPTNPSQPRPTG